MLVTALRGELVGLCELEEAEVRFEETDDTGLGRSY